MYKLLGGSFLYILYMYRGSRTLGATGGMEYLVSVFIWLGNTAIIINTKRCTAVTGCGASDVVGRLHLIEKSLSFNG